MEISDILIRLLFAIVVAGVIGFDRAYKNRPAGIRTHILVCVGATIIALIQSQVYEEGISLALQNEEMVPLVNGDRTRMIAQVISGIGFLGAGSIIVTKHSVTGLTTAASLWASGGLGIAIGMGFYEIAGLGFLTILTALTILHRILKVPTQKKIEIQYLHKVETKEFISQYFVEHNIVVQDVDFRVDIKEEYRIYCNYYIVSLPIRMRYTDIIEDLSINKNITRIRLVNI